MWHGVATISPRVTIIQRNKMALCGPLFALSCDGLRTTSRLFLPKLCVPRGSRAEYTLLCRFLKVNIFIIILLESTKMTIDDSRECETDWCVSGGVADETVEIEHDTDIIKEVKSLLLLQTQTPFVTDIGNGLQCILTILYPRKMATLSI